MAVVVLEGLVVVVAVAVLPLLRRVLQASVCRVNAPANMGAEGGAPQRPSKKAPYQVPCFCSAPGTDAGGRLDRVASGFTKTTGVLGEKGLNRVMGFVNAFGN